MISTAALFLPVGIALLAILLQRRRGQLGLSSVPGPFLASFSTLWQIWHIIRGHGDHAILNLHRRHGAFVRISHREVSSSHPDTMNAILRPSYRKGDWYQALAVPDKHHQTPMSELDPKRHRERSTITQSAYGLNSLLKSEDAVDSCISLFRKQLMAISEKAEPIQLDHWLNFLAFDIIGELTFSSSFGFLQEGKDVGNSIKNIRFLMFYQALMGYMYWMHDVLVSSPFADMLGLKPMHHVFETAKTAIQNRDKSFALSNDMVAIWKRNIEKYPGNMEEREILAVSGMTIIAGSETMTGALGSVAYYLLKNPKTLQRLREEIDAATSKGQLSDMPKFDETKDLPYLQAVIRETMRHFPPVPFNLPRVAPKEGITIGDRTFPEGTVISVSPLVIHMNEDIFGKDAALFRPERWLEPNAEQRLGKYICTFGAGYNGCPGKQFAIAEMSKIITVLVRDFDIRLVNPEREWTYRNQFTVVQTGWPVMVQARHGKTSAS